MISLVYFLIILFANSIGAISGMGGGVIIKPFLDLVGGSPLVAINFYSSFAVFIMSLVSTYKQVKNGVVVVWLDAILLSLGSIFGGILGDTIFNYFLKVFTHDSTVNLIQIFCLIISLALALSIKRKTPIIWLPKSKHYALFLSGLFLGALATLLGIGGGPINVALLIYLFDMLPKKATVYSIITIFFSQFSKLIITLPHLNSLPVKLERLPIILFAAILGGLLGSWLSKKCSEKKVLQIYHWVILFVMALNLLNAYFLIF